jgi:hypothetical protein
MPAALRFRDRLGHECWVSSALTSAVERPPERYRPLELLEARSALRDAPAEALRRFVARIDGNPGATWLVWPRHTVHEVALQRLEQQRIVVFRAPPDAITSVRSVQEEAEDHDEAPVQTTPEDLDWIEIVLLDEHDQPVPRVEFEVTLPDRTIARGSLDAHGRARLENIPRGQCKVVFPRLDRDAWEPS